jgi:hypothetical protein
MWYVLVVVFVVVLQVFPERARYNLGEMVQSIEDSRDLQREEARRYSCE